MNIWKKLFGDGGNPPPTDNTDIILSQYGLVSDGRQFIFKGVYFETLQATLCTPEVCAAQTNDMEFVDEVCVMLTDPVLIVANLKNGPLAFRTSLPAERAQEFVDALNPSSTRILDSGKICLVKLRR